MIVRFFCWLFGECYHNWSKWEVVDQPMTWINTKTNQRSDYSKQLQQRRCNKCGKYEQEDL